MNRTTLALAAFLVALAARPAAAQTFGPPTNPYARGPVSPYLNLIRPGNPGINYYGLVRPQIETDRYIQQQEILAAQTQVVGATPLPITVTGHPTRFLSYSQYFMTTSGGGTALGGVQAVTGGATATAGTPAPRPAQAR